METRLGIADAQEGRFNLCGIHADTKGKGPAAGGVDLYPMFGNLKRHEVCCPGKCPVAIVYILLIQLRIFAGQQAILSHGMSGRQFDAHVATARESKSAKP